MRNLVIKDRKNRQKKVIVCKPMIFKLHIIQGDFSGSWFALFVRTRNEFIRILIVGIRTDHAWWNTVFDGCS